MPKPVSRPCLRCKGQFIARYDKCKLESYKVVSLWHTWRSNTTRNNIESAPISTFAFKLMLLFAKFHTLSPTVYVKFKVEFRTFKSFFVILIHTWYKSLINIVCCADSNSLQLSRLWYQFRHHTHAHKCVKNIDGVSATDCSADEPMRVTWQRFNRAELWTIRDGQHNDQSDLWTLWLH